MSNPDWRNLMRQSSANEMAEELVSASPPQIHTTAVGTQRVSAHIGCTWAKGKCGESAGAGTNHPGVGLCASHGGNSKKANGQAAAIMGHAYAQALDISPWDALIGEIKRTAGALRFLDSKVAEAEDDDDLIPGGSMHPWVLMRERERKHMLQSTKMAIDAGIAERYVQQQEMEVALLQRVLDVALAAAKRMGVDDDVELEMRMAMRNELLRIEAGVARIDDNTIEGSVSHG